MMWRHGDIIIAAVKSIPEKSRLQHSSVLAQGELTGHCHRVENPGTAEIWQDGGLMFLKVLSEECRLVHEEHLPISLPRGVYRFWQQREYTPGAIRRVAD